MRRKSTKQLMAILLAKTLIEGSEYCNECIWKEEEREKEKNEAAHNNPVVNNSDSFGNS